MTNNSLPLGFEKLKTEKPYLNLSKLPEGEHRFRIVQRPIAGWIDWKDKKPYRWRPENKPATSFDPLLPMKPFWILHVWDYARDGLYVMEITQNGIRKSLENYALNEDWGDLTGFDIKIKKAGSGKDTTYDVIPIPPKPMADKIKTAVDVTKIRLEALYEGKDPWLDLDHSAASDPVLGDNDGLTEPQQDLIMSLSIQVKDEDYLDKLEGFLGVKDLCAIKQKDFERTIKSLEKKITGGANGSSAVA